MSPRQLPLQLVGGASKEPEWGRRRRRLRGIDRCESPIETQLALAFVDTKDFRWRLNTEHPWRIGAWDDIGVALLAQPLSGPYRPDFALVPFDWRCPQAPPLVVEVDGHDFHERTKEQAEYDRARDRYMTASGSIVLRFTGSEVWRDRAKCAGEILSYVPRVR